MTVLTSFDKYGLKINKSKCLFLVGKLVYSGYALSADGISPDEHKVQAVKDCKSPTTVSEVRSFLGIVNFSKQFIHDYSTIAAPLRLLTKKVNCSIGVKLNKRHFPHSKTVFAVQKLWPITTLKLRQN